MMEQGSVRNLEQIQETDGGAGTPRAVTILLVALGAGCIVFAALALGPDRGSAAVAKTDPLGELVSQRASGGKPKATDLSSRDVTFPGILSDEGAPTTALAAVKGYKRGKGAPPPEPVAEDALEGTPPPPTDRLPVVPLPAQSLLQASPVVTRPRDALTRAASEAERNAASTQEPASPGRDGGYQLQVSSFQAQPEAEEFAAQLRARGHKAYVLEAEVPNRGTWYRVRIGPFATQQAASSYRASFEGREQVVAFVVSPPRGK